MSKFKPYRVCPDCGVHLDWGERCDCEDKKQEAANAEAGQSAAQLATQQTGKNRYAPVLIPGA